MAKSFERQRQLITIVKYEITKNQFSNLTSDLIVKNNTKFILQKFFKLKLSFEENIFLKQNR